METRMSDSSRTMEIISKALLGLLTIVVLPTFGWVWSAESRISSLESSNRIASAEIQAMRANATHIRLIQKDIEHINEKLEEIARLLENKK